MIKKNKVLSAILMLSGSVSFAGTMGAVCQEGNVTVPCDMKKWSVGGQALYMQMTTANSVADSTLTGSNGSFDRGNNPSWDYGFQLEGAYQFSNGKDLNLNWYHLRGSDSNNLASPVNLGTVVSPSDPVNTSNPTTTANVIVNTASTSQSSAWDMVNIEHGRQINIDEDFHARVHFGGEFSRVMQNIAVSTKGTTTSSLTPFSTISNTSAVYNGFGPRLGIDLVYATPYHIGFYGKGAVGVLAGTAKTSYTPTNASNQSSTLYYNTNRVVTSTDAKLGLDYTYAIAQGEVAIDAGWMWVNYLNALASQGSTTGAHNNAFGVQGVYFGAKWTGDMA